MRILRHILPLLILLFLVYSCKNTKSITSDKNKPKNLSGYDKRKFDYLFIDGLKEKMLGNFAEALEKYQRCIQLDPSAAAPYYEVAMILQNSGRAPEGIDFAKKAVALDPSNPWCVLILGDCYKTSGKFSESVLVFEKGVKLFPDRTSMYYELATAFLLDNKPEEAVKVYDKLELKVGVHEELSVSKQKIWLRSGKWEKAVSEIERLIKQYPKESKYYLIAGNICSQNKDPRALVFYNKALEVNPGSGMARLHLHDHYFLNKESAKAFEELKLAFRSEDVSIDTKTKILLEYYERSQKYKDMRSQADTLLMILKQSNPDNAQTFTILGDFYYRDKKYPESLDAFNRALELDKSRYAIWHQVMVIQSQLDLFKEMKETSSQTMELFPLEPAPYLFRGVALIQEKQYKEALDILKAGKEFVIENNELKSQFYSYMGEASYKNKEFKSAYSYFDKALEADEKNITVLNNYAYYLSLRSEELLKAEAMSKKANELEPGSASYQDTYAWVLYKLAKYADAKTWLEKAMQSGGENNANILEHYGDVLFRMNEPVKAFEYWEKAKKAGKGSEFLDKKLTEKKLFE